MNNVYYRFVHLASNPEYGQMPARLRMNVIGSPGIENEDFELFSLAVSAMNGCGLCIDSHERVLQQHGVKAETIQTAVRVAAVIKAVATVQCDALRRQPNVMKFNEIDVRAAAVLRYLEQVYDTPEA